MISNINEFCIVVFLCENYLCIHRIKYCNVRIKFNKRKIFEFQECETNIFRYTELVKTLYIDFQREISLLSHFRLQSGNEPIFKAN